MRRPIRRVVSYFFGGDYARKIWVAKNESERGAF